MKPGGKIPVTGVLQLMDLGSSEGQGRVALCLRGGLGCMELRVGDNDSGVPGQPNKDDALMENYYGTLRQDDDTDEFSLRNKETPLDEEKLVCSA